MNLSLAVALFKLVTTLLRTFEQQRWYQDGKAAADAEANAEQKRRVELANAARADVDEFADGVRHDPHQRD